MWRRIAETLAALDPLAAQAAAETAARLAATTGDQSVMAACAAALPAPQSERNDDATLRH